MTTLQSVEEIGTAAVRRLRLEKLRNGRPFMINSSDLPSNQCYLEYPDGSIKLVQLNRSARDFTFLRTLSIDEEQRVRQQYNLPRI